MSISFKNVFRGAWVAQLVKHQTLAQVMISQFMGLSPASGSVLTAQSLEPASDSVSPSLSAPPPLVCSVPVSLKINKLSKNYKTSERNVGENLCHFCLGKDFLEPKKHEP